MKFIARQGNIVGSTLPSFRDAKKILVVKTFCVLHHPTSCQCEIKIALGGASLCCHSFPSKFVEKSDDADIWAASHNKDEN